jgi:hypothetical protein
MLSQTVEIGSASYDSLLQLSQTAGEPVQMVLDKAIEQYRRHVFLMRSSQAFAELRSDPELWQAELDERQLWDGAIADGIEPQVDGVEY